MRYYKPHHYDAIILIFAMNEILFIIYGLVWFKATKKKKYENADRTKRDFVARFEI